MVKKVRKITKDYLEKAAFYYLGRYASGEGNLRTILENKIKRAAYAGSTIPPETKDWIEGVVDKCVAIGLVSDPEYAKMKVQSLLAQGKSLRKIQIVLQHKKVADSVIQDILEPYKAEGNEIDLKSALKYAKKRRFGPFRSPLMGGTDDAEGALRKKRKKEIAAMIRAGFSYGISIETLDGRKE